MGQGSHRITALALAAVLTLAAGACGGDGKTAADREAATAPTAAPTAAPTTTAPPPGPDDPAFADAGPYAVGVTTLTMADGRAVEVFYPAAPGSEQGEPRASYETDEPLPPELRAAAPAGTDLTFTFPAFRDLPVSGDGPFPVVLFSHGFGGWRLVQSTLTAGIASWGFVVASVDHLERGLATLLAGGATGDTERDAAVDRQVLDMLADPATRRGAGGGTVDFADAFDLDHVGVAGHSAGGATALALRADPDVDVAVAWASAPWSKTAADTTPVMMISAGGDIVLGPDVARGMYSELAGEKALVIIDGAGHNSFTDACEQFRAGVNLLDIAVERDLPIPDTFLELGMNGCHPDDLAPRLAWPVIQHFTVAFLRAHLYTAAGPEKAGLGDAVVERFDDVTLGYEHTP